MEERVSSIKVNGTIVSYLEKGSGVDVILVHGGLSDYRNWSKQLDSFSEKYHVIAISRRSHYPNPPKEYPADYSVETESNDLLQLIEKLQLIKPLHLVGSSYGGYVCALLARDHPSVVRSLVLSEPPILSLLIKTDGYTLYSDFKTKVENFVAPYSRERKYETGLREYMQRVAGRDLNQMPEEVRNVQLQNSQTLYAEVHAAESEPFGKSDAERIQLPTLLLTGEISIPYLKRTALELSKVLPNVTFKTISKAGHSMHTMNSKDYNELVLDFLGKH